MMIRELKKPPRFTSWLLARLVRQDYPKPALGDLEEEFDFLVDEIGLKRARRWYSNQVWKSIPSCLSHSIQWSVTMFLSYLNIAFRSMKRQKVYSLINIAGLSLGLACFILISLWAYDESRFDHFHNNKDRLFRVLNAIDNGGFGASVSYALGPELERSYPEIEASCRVWPWHRSLVSRGDIRFNEENFYLVDPSFFRMFTFPFARGNPQSALAEMNSIVLTDETATRYFGNEDPLGRIIHVDAFDADFTITGVVKNIPQHSHLQFDLVARVEHLGMDRLSRWAEWVAWSYVLLREGVRADDVEGKIADIYEDHLAYEVDFRPVFQPVTKVHLYAHGLPGLIRQVRLFSLIAVFILFIACANFMNLTTARSIRRAKEVGLRKVIGARKIQLVGQFLGETFFICYAALGMAMVLVHIALPFFNAFTGKTLYLFDHRGAYFFLLCLIVVPLTALISGSYPAFHLCAFRPAEVLRRQVGGMTGDAWFRRILVIFQFTVSIGLIIATLIVSKQNHFIRNKDIGLDRTNVVILPYNPELEQRFDAFRHTLERQRGIIRVTAAMARPTSVGQSIRIEWEGREGDAPFICRYTFADYHFFETFGMEIVEGRGFSETHPSDATESCVVNESLMKLMGEQILGKRIYFVHGDFPESARFLRVVGVVKDFHLESLRIPIRPFLYRIYRPFYSYVFVRIDPSAVQVALEHIESVFGQFAPEYPFEYEFLDDAFEAQYRTERQLGRLVQIFGALAIVISCLGLFGLAAFTAEQKTKEIGVRKVLGASVWNIVLQLSLRFIRWVFVAIIFAWPISYLLLGRWLREFAYRTHIGPAVFIISAVFAFAITFATVSFQAIKAALANPVEALRYE